MKVLHAIIALVFIFIGASLYTTSQKTTAALVALLIANLSLTAICIERALDRTPIEVEPTDGTSGE